MAVAAGTRVGAYEVRSLLGRGGMGEVYRARDTKLNRDVALKILPELFALDPDRLARFKREAQVLASLNHPNIGAIYGFEESNGVQALVLELVEGPTLADRIAKGPIPVDEALPIARQIAEALEAAHEQGVIHRDLKPANIKLKVRGAPPPRTEDIFTSRGDPTPARAAGARLERRLSAADVADCTVKVLDFGLAKALDPAPPPDLSQSPTITSPAMTRMGVILGTAAYMAPEQARGKTVDKRADIWAFGCVLYEMLTGKQAFRGDDVSDTLAAVLRGEPDWELLPSVPSGIVTLLRRCLEKDTRSRWHDIADVRVDIEKVQRDPDGAWAEPLGVVQGKPRNALVWAMAALVLGAVLTGLAAWNLRRAPAVDPGPVRFSYVLPPIGRFSSASLGKMAISPDGTRIAYVANRQLYLRSLDQFEGVPVPGTEGAGNPFFSPDGRWLGFHASGKLQRVSIAGGAPLTISSAGGIAGASWGPDDTIVFGSGSGLLRVPVSGGTPKPLTTPDPEKGEVYHGLPQILPDGRNVVFTIGTGEGSRIALLSLDTGAWRELLSSGAGAQYLSAGYLVFSETGNLRVVPFDIDSGEVNGAIVPALDGILWENWAGLETAWFAVSRTGNLVYVPGDRQELSTSPVWVDRAGRETIIAAAPALYLAPRVSPDGRQIAFVRIGENGIGGVWVLDVRDSRIFPVAVRGADYNPTWVPDSAGRLTFTSNGDLFETLVGRVDPPVRLLRRENYQFPQSWSPDGRFLAFMEMSPAGTNIWIMPREGHPAPLLDSSSDAGAARFSPQGGWLAYVSDETGQEEVYVRRYPGSERGEQVSRGGGREPVWSASGQELFYRSGDRMMTLAITTKPDFRSEAPMPLWEKPYFSQELMGSTNYDVAADGRFLMLGLPEESDAAPTQVNVVLNWFEELQERVAIP